MVRRFEATRINQNGRELYFAVVNAKEFFDARTQVERWRPTKPTNYQRVLREAKVGKIARFLVAHKGIMPTSVLVSVRNLGAGGFTSRKGSEQGVLEIPDEAELYIVDGQHRIEGLKRAATDLKQTDLADFNLPVVFLCTEKWRPSVDAEIEEGKQFVTINKLQTGVKGELVDSFLLALDTAAKAGGTQVVSGLPEEIVEMVTPRVRALLIALILNVTSGSVWQDKVQRPNQRRGISMVNQKAMTDSIEDFANLPSYVTNFPERNVGPLAVNLMHYWEAIMDYYPNALANPRDYWVQRRLGMVVFNRIFPKVDALLGGGSRLKADYTKALKKAKMPTEHYWSRGGDAKGVTSYTAVSKLSSDIWP